VVLALNRCIELWSNELANKMFGNNKLWIWLGVPTIYGLYYAFFTKPALFTGIYFSWFFNPHVGYIDDPQGIVIY
jgi:nematode chemoreceptor